MKLLNHSSRPRILWLLTTCAALLFSMPLMLLVTWPFLGDIQFSSLPLAVWGGLFWALVVCSFVGSYFRAFA